MKRILSCLLLTSAICFDVVTHVYGQEEPKTLHFFNFGGGYTHPVLYDASYSAIIYRGMAATAVAQYHRRKPSFLDHLDFRFDYGELSNETSFAVVAYYRGEGNYSYQKHLKNIWQDRLEWYAGGSINFLYTLHQYRDFSNNSFNNSAYSSISPQSSLVYNFSLWNRDFRAQVSAYIPILTFAMRPSYGSSNFFGFLDDERDDTFRQLLESGKLSTLNSFFRYSNTFSLEYKLKKNPNRLRLSYEWNYVRYNEPRLTQMATHNITFATMFNL
jgi:hypothetical protein